MNLLQAFDFLWRLVVRLVVDLRCTRNPQQTEASGVVRAITEPLGTAAISFP